MPSKKRATPISLQPLDALFGTNEETNNGICEIEIGSLHPFPNHPFQVKDDKNMEELSIYQVPTELTHIIQCVSIMMLQKQP